MWEALGHASTLAYEPWPGDDEALTRDATIEVPVPIDGKVRSRITTAGGCGSRGDRIRGIADTRVRELLAGRAPKKVIMVPGRLVNIVG